MSILLRRTVISYSLSTRPRQAHRLSTMPASIAQSQPSVSCSPAASFTPPPPSSTTPFQLAHSPLFPHHTRARSAHPAYPPRHPVPDTALSFTSPYPPYRPVDFTAASTAAHSPDPEDARRLTGEDWARRMSSHPYVLEAPEATEGAEGAAGTSGRPWNPFGRTGLRGRGKLYYWGPNHAADCILLRPSPTASPRGGLQLFVIKRGDTGEVALVGGMIDAGETPEACIRREFGEEAMGVAEAKGGQAAGVPTAEQRRVLDAIFAPANTRCVYRGYVDDARNTDNAWMETAAFMFQLPDTVSDEDVRRLFVGGSDASGVEWVECGEDGEGLPRLYASHGPLVKLALKLRKEAAGDAQPEGDVDTKQSKI